MFTIASMFSTGIYIVLHEILKQLKYIYFFHVYIFYTLNVKHKYNNSNIVFEFVLPVEEIADFEIAKGIK